jgi:CRP-like cAMP-binding protein
MQLRRDERVALIREMPLFANLSRRDLVRVARIVEERELEAGAELMREGEQGDSFYVVVEGEVDVLRRGRRVARLGPGSFVGEIALLSRAPRAATVTAATTLCVLTLDGDDFVELLDSIPELWLKVARALAERIDANEALDADDTAR